MTRPAEWTTQGVGKLNDTNVLPILEAVGKTLVRSDLDKAALIRGLNLCVEWHREAREYSTNKAVRDRERRLAMIYKKAKALDHLLAEDDSSMALRVPLSAKESFRAPINQIIQIADREIKHRDDEGPIKAYEDSFKIRSPFEWLVGFYLTDVFMLMSVAPIRDQKEFLSSKSPYVRFVQAVLAQLRIGVDGKPYSSASIIKAASSRFTGELRRKQATSQNDWSFWRNALLRQKMGLSPRADSKGAVTRLLLSSARPSRFSSRRAKLNPKQIFCPKP
jgi:hypothetical protein